MPMESKYSGKYFSILGDSISTLAGYNPPDYGVFYQWNNQRLAGIFNPEDTWWGQVIHTLGGRLLVNNSWSGSLVCKHPQCEIESYGSSDSRTGALGLGGLEPDVVMILMGLNDWGCGIPPAPTFDHTSGPVFSRDYQTILEKIRRRYPRAEIWCLTLPMSRCSRNPDFTPAYYRGGWHILDYCQAIRGAAEKAGCKIVDITDPARPCDTIDGYHPNAEGMKAIADAVLAQLTLE